MKKCQFCGETVSDDTIVCPWCGRRDQGADVGDATIEASRKQESQSTEATQSELYWPFEGIEGETCLGCLCIIPFWPLFPLGIWLIREGRKKEKQREQQRQHTMEVTQSVLLSNAQYVGGHPLMPESGPVVISLNPTHFTIYSLDKQYRLSVVSSIPLLHVTKAATGQPKTAREVYDQDQGYTIDVVEHSPFLSVIFKLKDHSYVASFESLVKATPQEWCNQIIALQFQLRESQTSRG